MTELKPCLLCGREAKLITVGDNRDLFVYQCAECGYIKAKTSEARRTKWGARKVWNTRTPKESEEK